MFDFFSWQHLSIMLVVALVVVGPKDLPRLMNMAGKWAGKARAMATEFRRSFLAAGQCGRRRCRPHA